MLKDSGKKKNEKKTLYREFFLYCLMNYGMSYVLVGVALSLLHQQKIDYEVHRL